MKLVPLVLAALGVSGAVVGGAGDQPVLIVITADLRGYLAPCGCSDPMMGGIRRRATVIRRIMQGRQAILIDNGGNIAGAGRQDEMKAETVAQSMADLGVTAMNFGPAEAALGRGAALQTSRLANGRLTTLAISDPQALGLAETVTSGSFLIAGAANDLSGVSGLLGREKRSLEEALADFIAAADQADATPILLFQGGHDQAAELARAHPKLGLIVYSAMGQPSAQPERVGSTLLVTPGERGKNVLTLEAQDGKLSNLRVISLGPEVRDDPVVSRFYDAYLRRVNGEKLLDRLPRSPSASFAGSWACSTCHRGAMRVWKNSSHRTAFRALDSRKHGSDPDCVSCHVVGLSSTKGFKSLAQTPHLAGVGCESCHGPALDHVRNPRAVRPSKASRATCLPCHNPDNSPNFDFGSYWRRIAH